MVLQAAPRQAVVWGFSMPETMGQKVIVSVVELNKTNTGVVGPDCKWSLGIDPVEAGGPYTIQAMLGSKKIFLQNVLFGDVWLCSGQSNMEFPLSNVSNEITLVFFLPLCVSCARKICITAYAPSKDSGFSAHLPQTTACLGKFL